MRYLLVLAILLTGCQFEGKRPATEAQKKFCGDMCSEMKLDYRVYVGDEIIKCSCYVPHGKSEPRGF